VIFCEKDLKKNATAVLNQSIESQTSIFEEDDFICDKLVIVDSEQDAVDEAIAKGYIN
jgi:hypothetical protein